MGLNSLGQDVWEIAKVVLGSTIAMGILSLHRQVLHS